MTDLERWLAAHAGIFEALDQANAAMTRAAGHAGDCATRSKTSVETHAALSAIGDKTAAFLPVIERAEALPPIPDADTQKHFDTALASWKLAAQELSVAAVQRDLPAISRNCDRLEAGTEHFFRMAAALTHARGMPCNPANPYC